MTRRSPFQMLVIIALSLFGVFGVTAFVFRRAGVSQETLSIVGGSLAYLFIALAAGVGVIAWRRRGQDVAGPAVRYLSEHPAVASAVGEPVRVGSPDGRVPGGTGAAQANIGVPVAGPAAEGRAELVMARFDRRWEVLAARLEVDGAVVTLGEGSPGGPRGR